MPVKKLIYLLLAFGSIFSNISISGVYEETWEHKEKIYVAKDTVRTGIPKNRFFAHKQATVIDSPKVIGLNNKTIVANINLNGIVEPTVVENSLIFDEAVLTGLGKFVFYHVGHIAKSKCSSGLYPDLSSFFLITDKKVIWADSGIECVDIDLGGDDKELWDIYHRGNELIALVYTVKYESYNLSEYVIAEGKIIFDSEVEIGGL